MEFLESYGPLLASAFSLLTAIVVSLLGYFYSRSIETKKLRYGYLNFALQKIVQEYEKANPAVRLEQSDSENIIRSLERAFELASASLRNASPFIDESKLSDLRRIEMRRSKLLRSQINASLKGEIFESISADDYSKMLTDYINAVDSVLKEKATSLRIQLESGNV